ncbi:MAG: transposase [Granulosicoccus sp.]|nr:transposase [Granulosicoccus sp.]
MARKPRIHFSGAVYHVILNGLDQQAIFKSVADRRAWESLVEEGAGRFGHTLHAYCWAKDHVQMAIEVGDAPLSKIMQNLSFRYTRHFNKQHQRNGALFHGRYKAILIDPDEYLNDLVRYIHNNPVRNGRAKTAESAKWTSHQAYLHAASRPGWLTTQRVLSSFGKTDKVASAAFARFVDAGRGEGERKDLLRGSDGGRLLGDAKFTRKALKPAKVKPRLMTPNQLVKRICKAEGIKEATLQNASRARRESRLRQIITYLAVELEVATLTDMAQRFNRDLTTMSRNQRYFRELLAEDANLQKHVRKLRRQLLAST